jgi:hypothetical protein
MHCHASNPIANLGAQSYVVLSTTLNLVQIGIIRLSFFMSQNHDGVADSTSSEPRPKEGTNRVRHDDRRVEIVRCGDGAANPVLRTILSVEGVG